MFKFQHIRVNSNKIKKQKMAIKKYLRNSHENVDMLSFSSSLYFYYSKCLAVVECY